MPTKKKPLSKLQGTYCGLSIVKSKCKTLTEQNEALREMLKSCYRYIEYAHRKGIGDKVDMLSDIKEVLRETSNDDSNS